MQKRSKGASNAHIMQCSDGLTYYCKMLGRPGTPAASAFGASALASELYVVSLATALGIATPQAAIVDVLQDLINASEAMSGCLAGPAFGTVLMSSPVEVNSNAVLADVTNLASAPAIVGLDLWVGNWDRSGNAGNLLVVDDPHTPTASSGTIREKKADPLPRVLVPIDNGAAFTVRHGVAGWTEEYLRSTQAEFASLADAVRGTCYAALLSHIAGEDPFGAFLAAVNGLSKSDLEGMWEDIPEAWAGDAAKEAVVQFLLSRRDNLARELGNAKASFPFWG